MLCIIIILITLSLLFHLLVLGDSIHIILAVQLTLLIYPGADYPLPSSEVFPIQGYKMVEYAAKHSCKSEAMRYGEFAPALYQHLLKEDG